MLPGELILPLQSKWAYNSFRPDSERDSGVHGGHMTMRLLLPGILICLLQAPVFAEDAKPPRPPSYCRPCLFYAGDFGNAKNSNGVANEEDLLVPNSEVLVPFDVPKTQRWKTIGLFTNDFSTVDLIDPQKAVWSIS